MTSKWRHIASRSLTQSPSRRWTEVTERTTEQRRQPPFRDVRFGALSHCRGRSVHPSPGYSLQYQSSARAHAPACADFTRWTYERTCASLVVRTVWSGVEVVAGAHRTSTLYLCNIYVEICTGAGRRFRPTDVDVEARCLNGSGPVLFRGRRHVRAELREPVGCGHETDKLPPSRGSVHSRQLTFCNAKRCRRRRCRAR